MTENTLKEFDQDELFDEDSYETPYEVFNRLKKNYGMCFVLDAAAKLHNTKCIYFLDNAMFQEWIVKELANPVDVWCNPPHTMTEEFIKRADAQHKKYNINIVMIVPSRLNGTKVWHQLIENETKCFVENHPVKGRPRFLKNGKKTKHPPRNAYICIVWRKK